MEKNREIGPQGRAFHIALFISALRRGGSERVLVNLAEYLNARGIRVTMVNQYEGQDQYTLSPQIGRVYSEIPKEEIGGSRVLNFLRRFRRLRRVWKETRPDVILSFIGKNNLMAILTSRFLKIPVAVSVRGEPREEYGGGLMRLLASLCFPLADGVILQTGQARDFFPERVRRKSVLMKNPLNPAFIRPPFRGEREKAVYAVGRMDENKNHEMIVRAFAALAERYPDYSLVLCGDGPCRKKLEGLAKELGLGERVRFPGIVEDVAERIYGGSVFVLSSYSEGMPNTLIEAMCMGLPVISTDCPCGGPAELVRDGENGLLVAPGDIAGLERALERILSDGEEAERMGRKAAELAKAYHPDRVCAEWMQYLLGLGKGTKDRPPREEPV